MNTYQAFISTALAGINWPDLICSNPADAHLEMEGSNEFRTHRVADVLSDFCNLQRGIASISTTAPSRADHFSPAWTLLRQCAAAGQFILDCPSDISQPLGRTEHEQQKLELQHVLLDAYARRHEAQKIYLRQLAAQRCISDRKLILDSSGGRPGPSNMLILQARDVQLQQELQQITDEFVYLELLSGDQSQGRWTAEDPGLYDILNWLSTRS